MPEETDRVTLTTDEVTRMDDICVNPPEITKHMKAAIEKVKIVTPDQEN